jgi:hypothetical protein
VKPPFRVEHDHAHRPDVHGHGPGAPIAWKLDDAPLAFICDDLLRPQHGAPAVGTLPVVVSRKEDSPGAGPGDSLDLCREASARLRIIAGRRVRNSAVVHVVANEECYAPVRSTHQRSAEGLEHRLAIGIGTPPVAKEVERGDDAIRGQGRHRRRLRKDILGTTGQETGRDTRSDDCSHVYRPNNARYCP